MNTENSHIRRRVIAPCLFLAGGLLTWLAIEMLRTLAASQAGMSAGPVSGFPNREMLIMWLLCLYFVVSAVCGALLVKRADLIAAAILAHLLVITAFCIFCSEVSSEDNGKFLAGALTLAVIMVVYFLPWIILWGNVVKNGDVQPSNPPPQQKKQDEGQNEIKLKY